MKKTLLILTAFSLMLISCRKESDSNFLEVSIAGKTYRGESLIDDIIGEGGKVLCDQKAGVESFAGEMETTEFRFDTYLYHYLVDTVFQKSVPGTYEAANLNLEGFEGFCNLDLKVSFKDKVPIDDFGVLQTVNRSHSVSGIKKYSDTEDNAVYLVTGKFTCTFMTSVNKIFSVTGKYQTSVRTQK